MRLMRHTKRARLSRALVFAALGLALGNDGAKAQQPSVLNLSDPYVTVDLSVVEDGGVGPGASLAIPGFGRRLLMPGTQIPVSKLHVAAPKQRVGRVSKDSLWGPAPLTCAP